MIDPSPSPSRRLRLFALVARWSLGLTLAFWVLLAAAWGTLHGFIVPRIAEWRAPVERLATQALGVPVRIGAIAAHSSGFFPTIRLSGVSVLDAWGQKALRLHSVIATVSARSLLRAGLEQLYIDAPELDVRLLADGSWQVAGIDVLRSGSTDSTVLDWVLQLPELVIRQGRLRFTDERGALTPVLLQDVDLVLRNRHWSHVLRLDASAGTQPGERLHIVGALRQPLLPGDRAAWEGWSGQWYASLSLQQIPALPWPRAWGIRSLQGQGAVRAWMDVRDGIPVGVTADLALSQARLQWQDEALTALDMQQLQGRLEGSWHPQGWQIAAQRFSFRDAAAVQWPASHWTVSATGPLHAPHSVHVQLDYADLGLVSALAQSLPLPATLRDAAARWSPRGTLHQLQARWLAPGSYEVTGQAAGLSLSAQPLQDEIGTPGVDGLDAAFTFSNAGGKAALGMHHGMLHFPGVFEEPSIPMQRLQAQLLWQRKDGNLRVDVPQLVFENEDAAGSAQGFWHTGDTAETRFPGYLQLQGRLERANGARVHRYLPLEIPALARHYVRDSVRQGSGRQVTFEVQGMLQDMPFAQPGSGRFHIHAPVSQVVYDFAPAALLEPDSPPWPTLTQLHATLVFDGMSMQVLDAETGFAGYPGLRMGPVSARIPDLQNPRLDLQATGQVNLGTALQLVRQSPLAALTDHVFDTAQAQGQAQLSLKLDLPIEQLEHSKVQGQIGFQRNTLQMRADLPRLEQLQGRVDFHERGFRLHDVQAQALGGPLQLHGGMDTPRTGVSLQAQGVATAEGLQHSGLVLATQLAQHLRGQAPYAVELSADAQQHQLLITSSLEGMAVNLPAPLDKTANQALPLRIRHVQHTPQQQSLQLDLGDRGRVDYALEQGRVTRGLIQIGTSDVAPLPQQGVNAAVTLPQLDLDAWLQTLPERDAAGPQAALPMWLPQRIRMQVQQLQLRHRPLQDVQADLVHDDGNWSGQLQSRHFAGHFTYQAPEQPHTAGHLHARFARLTIPKAEVQQLNTLPQPGEHSDVRQLPALDIKVEQLQVGDVPLGSMQIKARNEAAPQGSQWAIEQFDLTTPEARWRAHGLWTGQAWQAPAATHLDFALEIRDSGALLERFGLPDAVRDGRGTLQGQIAWLGSPLTPDWASMDGRVQMQIDKGQFLRVQPGIGKLLSVLSLQSLSRRINLDFRDVFSQGFAFDYIRGDIHIAQGVARTRNLEMTGLNAAVLMEGSADLAAETQQLRVVIVPEINAMTASLAASAVNPVLGVGSLLAQLLLRGPLMEAATRSFEITGTWADPVVTPVRNASSSQARPAQE